VEIQQSLEPSLTPGTLFANRYEILSLIGIGGMAEVYAALDTLLGKERVALKIIHENLSKDEVNIKRFQREIQITRKISHENIARTYDAGNYDGRFYFSMEYLVGTTLSELLTKGPVPFFEASRIVQQICAGLTAIHKAGVVHRDIKPSNIVLTTNGKAVITDFGIARTGNSDMTKSSDVLGSAPYMAPELWTGGKTSAATDIYALGALYFELVTGIAPFDGDSAAEMMFKHIETPPIRPSSINAEVPAWLDNFILRLLNKNSIDRIQSAEEVTQYIEENVNSSDTARVLSDTANPGAFCEESIIAAMTSETVNKKQDTKLSNPHRNGSSAWAVVTVITRMLIAAIIACGLYFSIVIVMEPYLLELVSKGNIPAFRAKRLGATVGLITTLCMCCALLPYIVFSSVMTFRQGLSELLAIATRFSILTGLTILANAFVFLSYYAIDSQYSLGPYLLIIAQHVVIGLAQIFLLVPSVDLASLSQQAQHFAMNTNSQTAVWVFVSMFFSVSIIYGMYTISVIEQKRRLIWIPSQWIIGLGLFMLVTTETLLFMNGILLSSKSLIILELGALNVKYSVEQLICAAINWSFLLFSTVLLYLPKPLPKNIKD
jgi:serine/threonine protein kinase